ncbi:MAG: PHP domain-containing protein [bacterium]|nr:PHP domain-containing protein [bacterium]
MKYAEMHCHTFYSDKGKTLIESLMTPEGLLKTAKNKGLDAVAITDHNTLEGNFAAAGKSKDYNIVVIPAMEIDTREGTQILAYGGNLNNVQPFAPAEIVIKQIHDNGGVAIIAHPFINFLRVGAKNLDRLILFVDGLEVFNCHFFADNSKTLAYAKAHKIRLMTGGSDAHHQALIGNVVLAFPDSCQTADDFISSLKKGDFSLVHRVPRAKAIFLEIIMFFYTQIVGFAKRLA